MSRIVIVGASLAGAHAARAIRTAGFDDEVLVIGEEPHLPYDRPPLSKQFLTSDYSQEKLTLRPTKEPGALDLGWKTQARVAQLDVKQQKLLVENLPGHQHSEASSAQSLSSDSALSENSETISFDGLVVATGARPRQLPQSETGDLVADRLFYLRTVDDALRIKRELQVQTGRVVICGAGFIGLEVASSARQLGLEVTVVDVAPTPLNRVLNSEAGEVVANLHRDQGVDLRLGVGLAGVVDESSSGSATVSLTDGSQLTASVVVVGIGAVPNVEWMNGNDLDLSDGLLVDEACHASPVVVAAGDVARWPNELFDGALMRVEQWDNAVEMGAYAGKRLVAAMDDLTVENNFAPVPWFWSDQYDQKIQLAGLVTSASQLVIGSYAERRFVEIFNDEGGVVVGALAWNRPRHAIIARQLIAGRATVPEAVKKLAG